MRKTFQIAAAALAVVLTSATAQGFVLEPKGKGAKWRTDIVKKNATYTVCLLNAWNKCETSATKEGLGTPGVDCALEVDPAIGGATAFAVLPPPLNGYHIGALDPSATTLTKLNDALDKCDSKVNDPDPKKGLSAQNKDGFTLADIGCPGDCGTADGTQPCADVDAYEVASVQPLINNRLTAVVVGSTLSLFCAGAGDVDGSQSNELAKKAIKYIQFATQCQQKCQDDLKDKFGNGFNDDTTNCIVGASADPNFNACMTSAGTKSKLVGATECGGAASTLLPVLASSLNNATNGSYDRTDLQAAQLSGALAYVGDRAGPGVRVSFGATCPTNNDGLLEDYEECDTGTSPVLGIPNNALCGVIPGTIAGACGTATNPIAGTSPGRCPRP